MPMSIARYLVICPNIGDNPIIISLCYTLYLIYNIPTGLYGMLLDMQNHEIGQHGRDRRKFTHR